MENNVTSFVWRFTRLLPASEKPAPGKMKTSTVRAWAALAFILAFPAAVLFGQTTTASLSGTLADPTNAVIPGAMAQLSDQATGAIRNTTTDSAGLFRFLDLQPGVYRLTVQANGFKSRVENGIQLSAGESRDLGHLTLEVGSQAESVTVTAEATPVQTSSSEKGALIDSDQLAAVTLKGRDAFGYMQLLPGVLDTSNREIISTAGDGGISVNGNTTSMSNMVDGIPDRDAGASSGVHFEPNQDAIQEVKLLTSNYQAEFGRNSGGVITIVTKSGGQDFHGSGWWNHRNEGMDANTYINNESGKQKALYRYNIDGWSLGGPAYIPRVFNRSRTKFFFFASQEFIGQFVPATLEKDSMPTALERAGNFSQSVLSSGKAVVINNPSTGAPFAGNIIPPSLISPVGQATLNFMPLPNYFPSPGSSDYNNYNYTDQGSAANPVRDTVIRGDANLTSKLSGYFRWTTNYNEQQSLYQGVQWINSTTSPGKNIVNDHINPGDGYAASVTYTITPTLVNQATFGHSKNEWGYVIEDASLVDRSLISADGQTMPFLFPSKDAPISDVNGMHNFLPSVTFGGGTPPNPGSIGLGSYQDGYLNYNPLYVYEDNLSKVWGKHTFKMGVNFEHNTKVQPSTNGWNGSLSFAVDANNPLNTGDAYANAVLGDFDSYSEASTRTVFDSQYWDRDFYFQDNWRVTHRLTLDLGIRFENQQPQHDVNHQFSSFVPSLYNAADAPQLYQPYCTVATTPCPTGDRFARAPGSGALAPVAAIGLFVPGTGNIANGMETLGVNGVTPYSYSTPTFGVGPRVGFAYDVFGDGKMAIRGGFGIYYDRLDGNEVYNMASNPPLVYTSSVYYSSIASLSANGTSGLVGPATIGNYLAGNIPFDRVQNASVSIQRALKSMVLEVGYVGNWGYNLNEGGVNLNSIPLGADFTDIDPTTGKVVAQNLEYVNYPGYAGISVDRMGGHSNYNGLQTSLQHRLAHNLQFGVSYTYSKSLGTTSYDPLVPNNEERNYGLLSNDRKNLLAVNYAYNLPKPGQMLHNRVLGAITDYWTLSGIIIAQNGAPFTPGCSSSTGADITGSPNETARCNVVGNPYANVPAGAIYNPAAFELAPVGSIGNLGNNALVEPGFYNLDATMSKVIHIGLGEKRVFKIAMQGYNIFNHPEFNGWVTSGSYSASANPAALITSNEGVATGTRPARILETSLRFEF